MELGEIFLGDLVLDKHMHVVQVKSLCYRKVLFDAWNNGGPAYRGFINEEPAINFSDCPVTLPLLEALGWTLDTGKTRGLAYASPGSNQLMEYGEERDFEVVFVLADRVFENYRSGKVLYRDGDSDDWFNVESMIELGWAFYRFYSRRMFIELPDCEEYFYNESIKIGG